MTIEQHVTSLQLSQRLKELGVPQNSFYCWVDRSYWIRKQCHVGEPRWELELYDNVDLDGVYCSAYLASELLHFLPNTLKNNPLIIEIQKSNQLFHTCYGIDTSSLSCYVEEIFSDTLAKILIDLLETGHVSAGDL